MLHVFEKALNEKQKTDITDTSKNNPKTCKEIELTVKKNQMRPTKHNPSKAKTRVSPKKNFE